MKNCKIILYSLIIVLLLTGSVFSAKYGGNRQGELIAISDGKGKVDLLWMTRSDHWPMNGWRLKDMSDDTTLVESILPGVAKIAPGTITEEEAAAIAEKALKIIASGDKKLKAEAGIFLLMENIDDFQRLKAMGLGWTLHNVPPGKHQYSVTRIDNNGKASGPFLESLLVDTSIPTPLPAKPANLRGEAGEDKLSLFWTTKQADSFLSVISYTVKRTDGQGNTVNLTPRPIMTGKKDPEKDKAVFIDRQPPPEQQLSYRVVARDLFGRQSKPTEISLFYPDAQALWPPGGFTVEGQKNRMKLSWKENQNPFTVGYLIERSRNMNSRYQPLNVKPIPSNQVEFIDKENLIPGLTYYYRIRSVNPRGRLGKPSFSIAGTPKTGGRPRPPNRFQAKVKPTRVHLSWEPMTMPVAGYIVEKQPAGADDWGRLNGNLLTTPNFEDRLDLDDFGEFSYRVIAVAFDNKKSKPSKKVSVTLLGKPRIPPPYLKDIRSNKGIVTLKFMKSEPVKRTDEFLVIRGISLRDKKGLIVSDPIDGDETEFEDKKVKPGEDYWYQLLAIGKDKRRSEPSNKLYIKIDAPDIPQAGRPKVTFKPKPFPHMVINFKKPPGQLLASIHRRENDEDPWVNVADSIRDSDQFIDADPPRSGQVQYRILYSAENGKTGLPSKARILMVEK